MKNEKILALSGQLINIINTTQAGAWKWKQVQTGV